MKPGPLKALFPDVADDDFPRYGEVTGEAVYFMRPKAKVRLPTPPQMKNHGNWVISISQLARWMSDQAEELGAYMLPETDCQKVLIDQGRVRASSPATRARPRRRGAAGVRARRRGAGPGHRARRGHPGHLTSLVRGHFDLDRDSTQIWELGVKEVWRVPRPLGQVVHTLGWPLRLATKYREYGGSWLYPMGDDMISMGFVVGLDYADATLSAHDLLQEFKTHPFIRASSRAASGWPGAKTIPGAVSTACPAGCTCRARCSWGTAPGSWT